MPMTRYKYITKMMLELKAMQASLYGAKVFSTCLGLNIGLDF